MEEINDEEVSGKLINNKVYRVLKVLSEISRKEHKYAEDVKKHLPDMELTEITAILELLLKCDYATSNSVYRIEKQGDKRFYSSTIFGDSLHREISNMVKLEKDAYNTLAQNQKQMREKLGKLEKLAESEKTRADVDPSELGDHHGNIPSSS